MGARLGTRSPSVIEGLREYGLRLGIAFQIRDDVLGIWATNAQLGKTEAGDLYRRKKTLPVLHALSHAHEESRLLREIFRQEGAPTEEEIKAILAALENTHSLAYCREAVREQCALA